MEAAEKPTSEDGCQPELEAAEISTIEKGCQLALERHAGPSNWAPDMDFSSESEEAEHQPNPKIDQEISSELRVYLDKRCHGEFDFNDFGRHVPHQLCEDFRNESFFFSYSLFQHVVCLTDRWVDNGLNVRTWHRVNKGGSVEERELGERTDRVA